MGAILSAATLRQLSPPPFRRLVIEWSERAKNPAAGVKHKGPKVSPRTRQHIPLEDLNKLFGSPVFTAGARPGGGKGEAAFWLPLLGLFTGARLGELVQIRVADVQVADDIDYLNLTDEGKEQNIKTEGSRHRVPIHPELVRLGFLDYVKVRRAAKDERLFPLLKEGWSGSWTDNWSQWWRTYRHSVGVTERWRDFHALRHTFKRQCRECGIPKEIHDAITGHESGDVGDAYGGQHPLKPLADAMRTLRYPGLDLAGVK